jgi:hypothetical protein
VPDRLSGFLASDFLQPIHFGSGNAMALLCGQVARPQYFNAWSEFLLTEHPNFLLI